MPRRSNAPLWVELDNEKFVLCRFVRRGDCFDIVPDLVLTGYTRGPVYYGLVKAERYENRPSLFSPVLVPKWCAKYAFDLVCRTLIDMAMFANGFELNPKNCGFPDECIQVRLCQ